MTEVHPVGTPWWRSHKKEVQRMEEQELIEQLADKAHASWSHWMEYLFEVCKKQDDGTVVIPRVFVERWQRQIATPYAELSEREKQSDRIEVAHILPTIKRFFA